MFVSEGLRERWRMTSLTHEEAEMTLTNRGRDDVYSGGHKMTQFPGDQLISTHGLAKNDGYE